MMEALPSNVISIDHWIGSSKSILKSGTDATWKIILFEGKCLFYSLLVFRWSEWSRAKRSSVWINFIALQWFMRWLCSKKVHPTSPSRIGRAFSQPLIIHQREYRWFLKSIWFLVPSWGRLGKMSPVFEDRCTMRLDLIGDHLKELLSRKQN